MTDALTRPARGMDADRLLLLTVAVILVQNRASTALVLALLYAAL